MRHRIPPLAALSAFEAAARRLSFRDAAGEIGVTPSAISHAVRSLEATLGVALFRRAPRRLALTAAGEAYLQDLTPLLDALDASTRRVARRGPDDRLRVLATPGFAARWLIPRLDRFAARDRLEIRVSDGAPSTDFALNGADVVIHWGAEPVAGAVVAPLLQSGRYPVAAPEFAVRKRLQSPRDLLRVTLLHDDVSDGWAAWFRHAGVVPPGQARGPSLAHCELTLTAAERGQGVALAYDAMARDALADGRLVRLFEIATPPATIYSFAHAAGRQRCPLIGAFRDWIFAEVAAEGTRADPTHHHAAE